MDESINKGILIAVGLIATLIIASLVFVGVRYGRSMANSSFQKAANMAESAEQEEYTSYIGETVSGNQVISLIRQWQPYPVSVVVKTKSNTGGKAYNYNYSSNDLGTEISATDNSDALVKAKQKTVGGSTNRDYINPNGRFLCSSTADSSGGYSVIVFTQQ